MSAIENNLRWTFDPETGEEEGANDALGQNFRQRPYASLLREAVQNALDVPSGNGPVIVNFSFGKIDNKNYPCFFELKDHIQGCIDYWSQSEAIVSRYKRMQECFSDEYISKLCYLKISDRNTQGMAYEANNNNLPFFAFVRASKVSVKGNDNTGGTYGFGKAAYFQLSPIGTLLISTMTDKGRSYFEGKSVLCTHTYKGEKKTSVGYYDNNNGKGPISQSDQIPPRFRKSEPGTDFYILGFLDSRKDIAIEEMKYEALRSFFVAIHRRKLVLEFEYSKDKRLIIDSDSLPTIMKEVFPESVDNSGQFRTLNPRPYYDAIVNEDDGSKYRTFTDVLPNIGRVYLYVKRAKDYSDKILYMRRPYMTVFAKNQSTSVGMAGVFVCDDLRGDNKLKKIENSSHTMWRPELNKDALTQDTIEEGRIAFREVNDYCDRCLRELSAAGDKQELEIAGLDDMLYVPDSLIGDEENEEEKSVGQPSGEIKDEGLSLTTDIAKEEYIEREPSQKGDNAVIVGDLVGGIVISSDGSDVVGVDQSGHRRSGKGNSKPGSELKPVNRTDTDGSSYGPINVTCRSFAQLEGGLWWHYITIHTDAPIYKGYMDILVCGENGDVSVNLAETTLGAVNDNRISGIELPSGATRFKVRFTDNMKYTLRTALSYE